MPINILRAFIKLEAASAIVLIAATVLALILANSPYQHFYTAIFNYPLPIFISLQHFINNGLMSIFFLLVTLEIKREMLVGELNSRSKALLPCVAAAGGMLLPAVIYLIFNFTDPIAVTGWAIPSATDIAFSLALLSLLSSRIPASLKAFLMALAIIDDLGAIIIIALFYTLHLSYLFLLLTLLCLVILIIFNCNKITKIWPYILVGILLWIFMVKSGVHATIAGVILGFTIPLNIQKENSTSALQKLEHALHPWVAFGILPLFALANAGLSFAGISKTDIFNPITLGIVCGLFFGKQLGVFGASWLAIKTKLAALPSKVNWQQLYGVSLLCGIGFTMSLFIGTLAFPETAAAEMGLVKLGVLSGSLLSAIAGYLLLRLGR